ncbi:hypothetical protein NLI96_g9024 [Meripilus lineatus]|uniref:Major facilitator superfamily (MFS) profile domain-containing protein n=1 Tax=Meripilus lineatus TaxID=2056292 RepID=A0AAD5UXV7_9APHY|nr:hypothetical protein NLI96_g9024 [Physisporinus lineatus]
MTESESTWIMSAFQLTFASFLLISGRVCDIYSPKFAFISGVILLGIFTLGSGLVVDKISFIVFRALCGIATSLVIPSALALLVTLFPNPLERAHVIGIFSGSRALGIFTGLLVGALILQFAHWPWIFWLVALVTLPMAAICMLLIPGTMEAEEGSMPHRQKWRRFDHFGVSILTVGMILFIFAVTSGSISGWGSAFALAPLLISLAMVVGFFFYETRIPAEVAAV